MKKFHSIFERIEKLQKITLLIHLQFVESINLLLSGIIITPYGHNFHIAGE